MKTRAELLAQIKKDGRDSLSRAELRFADSGHDDDRFETIRALLNSATAEEQATLGYRAAIDLLQMLEAERDETDRQDAKKPRAVPSPPNRFFR